jgi:hypothetical protein
MKQKNKQEITTLRVTKETKLKIKKEMANYNIYPFEKFINLVLKILNKFKPELQEIKNA